MIGQMRALMLLLVASLIAAPALAERVRVSTPDQFKRALKKAAPGDTVVLANGTYRDFELVVRAEGTAERPITVEAEQPGKVILSGASSLKLAGHYLHVRGLVFRDGYSPDGEVIAFRKSKNQMAFHSRVSEMVIDGYSHPDRFQSDHWVVLYGQHNRFDHNHLVGKTNAGVTLAVRLDSEDSRNNHHRIDHNYFGPRPVLGSNGGETIRIGTSAESMFDSATVVERNVFDRCDGEVEIISSKSGANVYRGNLFLASQGTLTLRHGDGNRVEDNVFFGRGVENTGGIRVINRNQIVRNNYMEGLRGSGFSSALTVMNGVPNSPVNRYVQVTGAEISHNTVVDSHRVALAAGSDAERSAPPKDSAIEHNLLFGMEGQSLLTAEDDISGLRFSGNFVGGAESIDLPAGVESRQVEWRRADNGLLYPQGLPGEAGVSRQLTPMPVELTGVSWYAKPEVKVASDAEVIDVAPGQDSLSRALAQAAPGATLRLAAGHYVISRVLAVDKPLSIVGPAVEAGTVPTARLSFTRSTLFDLQTGASLRLVDLELSGAEAPDAVGNALLRTASQPPAAAVELELLRVRVTELKVNAGFHVFAASKHSLARRIQIIDSVFENITGSIIAADTESDDFGRYNVEDLQIRGSRFLRIGLPVVNLYRGGSDESTFGPRFLMQDSQIIEAGRDARQRTPISLRLHGVQQTLLQRNRFERCAPLQITHTVGTPSTEVIDNQFVATAAPTVTEINYGGEPRAVLRDNRVEESL